MVKDNCKSEMQFAGAEDKPVDTHIEK